MQDLEHFAPHMMIWVGMTLDYLTGTYVFYGLLNAADYLAVLDTWLTPQLRDTGLTWWGTRTLHSLCAWCFEQIFCRPLDWLCFTDFCGTINMAPHGHNVTTPNNSIWCSMNGRVVAHHRTTNKELWKTPFTPLLHKCSDKCHRGHGDASACVSSIMVHKWIHWPCNWEVCCLMCGDFLPSL